MTRNWIARLSFLFLLFATFTFAHAQDNASMTGVITDTSGAVLPDTTVVLVNAARGIDAVAVTGKDGSYRFPNVPPAPGYKATFSHAGFTSYSVDEIGLLVGITRTQNAQLNAGASTTLEVSARANEATLNTTDASIGNNFDVQMLNDLPVQARNSPAALFTLQPGVNSVGATTGARTDQNSVSVDGMDVNDISTGQFSAIVGNLPVDAVQEFRATVAGLPMSIGTGGGGQFQLVTKSGTNKFHGNINEYHRDTATSANTWFNNIAGVARTPLIRNQFGGALGGPVWKDKLFFFADFLDSRIIQSLNSSATVPLDSYRAGNISYVKTGCSPTTSRQNTTPACIGTLTPAQVLAMDPAGIGESATMFALFNSRYPRANDLSGGDGVNTGLNRFTQPAPNFEYDGVARLDYNITSKQRVFLRFNNVHRDSIQSANRFGGDPVTRPFQDRSYGYVGSHIWEIGNNKVNQFYYGDNVSVLSFPLAYNPNGATFVGNTLPFTAPYDGSNIQRRRIPIPTVRDDFNWTRGAHNISFGGTFKFIKAENFLGSDYNTYTLGLGGNVTSLPVSLRPADIQATGTTNTSQFDNAFTLALGRVARVSSIYNFNAAGVVQPSGTGANRRYRYYQTELYVGDTWKATKELTVTYGIRYQLYSVPYEALGAESIPSTGFDDYFSARLKQSAAGVTGNNAVPLISYSLGGKVNGAPGYYASNLKDLAPRVAFSYNPSYAPKTVLNASADIVYDRTVANAVNFLQNQATFLFQNSVATSYGASADPTGSLKTDPRVGGTLTALPAPPVAPALNKPFTPNVTSTGALTGLTSGLTAIGMDSHLKDPYSISYNAGVQQEFPGHFVMRLNYAGRLGRRLLGQVDASQLIDFPDAASGQTLGQAFAYATTQVRNKTAVNTMTPQPFFEHVFTPNFYVGKSCGTQNGVATNCNSNTAFVAFNQATFVNVGDITDALQQFTVSGLAPANAGLAGQFARNTFYTNKGFSNYHGLLLTVTKNLSQGVRFDFNYTWSHSIDNVSLVANSSANNTGFICDATRPRACRGNSDFDTTHIITSDFVAQLPFGRGKLIGGHVPWYVNEAIGGWSISGTPTWQSGIAFTTQTSAFLAGFANQSPAIYDGSGSGDLAVHLHKDSANRLLLYADQTKALSHFRGPIGIEYGSRNTLRGPSQLYLDMGLGKTFQILPEDKLRLVFRADAFNVLNHPTFAVPTANITSSAFGVVTAQSGTTARVGQFSLRLEF